MYVPSIGYLRLASCKCWSTQRKRLQNSHMKEKWRSKINSLCLGLCFRIWSGERHRTVGGNDLDINIAIRPTRLWNPAEIRTCKLTLLMPLYCHYAHLPQRGLGSGNVCNDRNGGNIKQWVALRHTTQPWRHPLQTLLTSQKIDNQDRIIE